LLLRVLRKSLAVAVETHALLLENLTRRTMP
jgi:hypothetical protein